jgi:hypothetical protein
MLVGKLWVGAWAGNSQKHQQSPVHAHHVFISEPTNTDPKFRSRKGSYFVSHHLEWRS